jgi:hypothetical protein
VSYEDFLGRRSPANKVAILVAPSQTSPNIILKAVGPSTVEVIEDNRKIQEKSSKLMNRSKFARTWQRAKEFVSIIDHVDFSLEIPSGEKYTAAYYPNIAAPRDELPDAYIIDEDEITRDQFSSFLAPFARLPERRRPKVIIRPKRAAGILLNKLRPVSDKIEVLQIGRHGFDHVAVAAGDGSARTTSELLESYVNFGFTTMAEGDIALPPRDADAEEVLAGLYRFIFRINAAARTDSRRTAAPLVRSLAAYLDSIEADFSPLRRAELLRVKIFANLLHGYVVEASAEEIRNALALAHHLKDTFLIALGERLINLAEGINPSALHWLHEAEKTFWQMGEPVQAIYAVHNRLLTALSTSVGDIEFASFLDHAEKLKEIAPYAERMSTVMHGEGLLHLLSDNLGVAQEVFQAAEGEAGTWLHRMEARVSRLTCLHLSGYLDEAQIVSAASSIVHQLGQGHVEYHHSILFYNLLRMSEGRRCYEVVAELGRSRGIVSEAEVCDLRMLFARFTGSMPVSAPGGRYRGRRGEFFERTGLVADASFIWH